MQDIAMIMIFYKFVKNHFFISYFAIMEYYIGAKLRVCACCMVIPLCLSHHRANAYYYHSKT